ncbi:DUF4956 domain-containing protein [Anaerocolumna xylanovorans]|uniref:DUF4956 domain-containing protein n=1 Tax=Anaerocolumna xylanovorans DSM 12503 TaxID=1121345 RepID=A0A1M7XZN5_9FIRM|nr:DUF4956 domain-containing protein [Anaerocolumna xylanovorans]SHO44638.1 protein of unknown function [Anaerocolumna xylanovorans DSM 12503]
MFTSIIDSVTGSLTIESALICTVASLVLGGIIALIYMVQGSYTKSFIITLILLPALVQAVIMVVNGNLGAGVAVMGAFSLVRFRSIPGSSKEISSIFFAMVVGLAAGMGYVTYAALITVVIGLVLFLLSRFSFGEKKGNIKELRVTIPENLDYTDIFDDIFKKYTKSSTLTRVKTTNLGSMYDLFYEIELQENAKEKEMIDDIRCRNGNLTIVCGRIQQPVNMEL